MQDKIAVSYAKYAYCNMAANVKQYIPKITRKKIFFFKLIWDLLRNDKKENFNQSARVNILNIWNTFFYKIGNFWQRICKKWPMTEDVINPQFINFYYKSSFNHNFSQTKKNRDFYEGKHRQTMIESNQVINYCLSKKIRKVIWLLAISSSMKWKCLILLSSCGLNACRLNWRCDHFTGTTCCRWYFGFHKGLTPVIHFHLRHVRIRIGRNPFHFHGGKNEDLFFSFIFLITFF